MLAKLLNGLALGSTRKLKARGVMGMNRRNSQYIGRYNPRHLFPNVDDKLKTKQLAIAHQLAVPDLITVVSQQHQIRNVFSLLRQQQGFAIKPAKGSGGKGILVIIEVNARGFKKASGEYVCEQEVIRHLSNILAGLFSLGGHDDVAIIEALIQFDPVFSGLSYQGVPDIRLIVFNGLPVMAMLRLATLASDGKANLHQGAVGVGLDIGTGKAIHAVQYDRPISFHPDTGQSLSEVVIAHWQQLLLLASQCYQVSGLGYLGADLVLDHQRGPLLLELNARPGLAIQIANNAGLLPRLKKIEDLGNINWDTEQKVAYAIDNFSC
jgi:alpha-L-glutamate ligase-like protein